MQIRSLDPSLARTAAPAGTATQRSSATPLTGTARPTVVSAAAPGEPPARPGVARWAAGWQRQVGGAQQSLDYLGALGRSLGELKTGLSRTLALGTGAPASLRQQRDAVAALWEQRRQATAGTLDNQGEWTADGGARRNADQGPGPGQPAKPGAGGAELFGAGHAPAADLAAGASRSPAEALRALDDALAPAGLQTRQDEDGTVWFSVAEDQWPALRDGLTVRGGGQRFPAGQPARLRMEAQPDVLQARSWGLESTADQRATLQAVVRAQDWVRRQSDTLRQRLAEWEDALPPPPPPTRPRPWHRPSRPPGSWARPPVSAPGPRCCRPWARCAANASRRCWPRAEPARRRAARSVDLGLALGPGLEAAVHPVVLGRLLADAASSQRLKAAAACGRSGLSKPSGASQKRTT
jgi:hypothetical protein